MKKFFSAIAIVAFVLGAGDVADAAFIHGSIAFAQSSLVPDGTTVDLLSITTFTTDDFTSTVPKTDDFSTTPNGTPVTGNVLDATSAATLATWGFTDLGGGFGTFAASSGSQISATYLPGVGNLRAFSFLGTFTPGTLYPGLTGSPNNATVLITMNQAGRFDEGQGRTAISASFTLDVAAPRVPEPSTIVMLAGVFGPAVAFGWIQRRRKSKV